MKKYQKIQLRLKENLDIYCFISTILLQYVNVYNKNFCVLEETIKVCNFNNFKIGHVGITNVLVMETLFKHVC